MAIEASDRAFQGPSPEYRTKGIDLYRGVVFNALRRPELADAESRLASFARCDNEMAGPGLRLILPARPVRTTLRFASLFTTGWTRRRAACSTQTSS